MPHHRPPREIDLDREMDLIFSPEVPARLQGAMLNILTREMHEQTRARLAAGRAEFPEDASYQQTARSLERTLDIEGGLVASRISRHDDTTMREAWALLQRLRRRAGLLPRIETATPAAVSAPIPALSDEAAIFSLIADTGGTVRTCRCCGSGFYQEDRRNTARCGRCRKGDANA